MYPVSWVTLGLLESGESFEVLICLFDERVAAVDLVLDGDYLLLSPVFKAFVQMLQEEVFIWRNRVHHGLFFHRFSSLDHPRDSFDGLDTLNKLDMGFF